MLLRRLLRSQAGQTATEYMMVISVVVIGAVAASYVFVPSFQDGVDSLAQDTSSILDNGTIGGTGTDRDGGGSNGGTSGGTNGGSRGMRNIHGM